MLHIIDNGAFFDIQSYTILNPDGSVNKTWIEGKDGVTKILVILWKGEDRLSLMVFHQGGEIEMYTRG